MPTALDDPAYLARLRAEAKATAARIAAATREKALKAAEERRVSESGGTPPEAVTPPELVGAVAAASPAQISPPSTPLIAEKTWT